MTAVVITRGSDTEPEVHLFEDENTARKSLLNLYLADAVRSGPAVNDAKSHAAPVPAVPDGADYAELHFVNNRQAYRYQIAASVTNSDQPIQTDTDSPYTLRIGTCQDIKAGDRLQNISIIHGENQKQPREKLIEYARIVAIQNDAVILLNETSLELYRIAPQEIGGVISQIP